MGASNSRRRPSVGVLFVHGIGEQRRGDALTAGAEPLLAWVDSWAKGRPAREGSAIIDNDREPAATVVNAHLQNDPEDAAAPAYAQVLIADGDWDTEWLLAESCWAEEFH
ncbi:MAG: hypothetical protein LC808_17860, partial [Actinobacteria bacterium]|nr:hypothetical protein [Actinomycetota bacterium]